MTISGSLCGLKIGGGLLLRFEGASDFETLVAQNRRSQIWAQNPNLREERVTLTLTGFFVEQKIRQGSTDGGREPSRPRAEPSR